MKKKTTLGIGALPGFGGPFLGTFVFLGNVFLGASGIYSDWNPNVSCANTTQSEDRSTATAAPAPR